MKKILLIILLLLMTILLFLYLRQPKEDELLIDDLYLSPDEVIELQSLEDNDYVMGVLENDSISEFILSNIADKFELNFRIQYFSELADLLESVKSGDVDFASNITYSDERNELLDFTSPVDIENTYLVSYDEYLVNNLSGKTIGVAKDSIYEYLILENFNDVNIRYYYTYEDFFEMIIDGSVDGSVGNIIIIEEALRQGMETTLLNEKIPIKPVSLITKLNSNEILMTLFSKYIKTSEYQLTLLSNKEAFIDGIYETVLNEKIDEYYPDHDIELNIKLENNPPFSYFDENGDIKGIFADTLFDICSIIDIRCEVSNTADETWNSMFNNLRNSEIDILGPVAINTERVQYLYFSDSILTSRFVMLSRGDYDNRNYNSIYQLVYEKIGTIENDIKHEYLTNVFPNKEFIYFDSNTDLIMGLSNGDVDYILINEFAYYEYTFESKDFSVSINENIGTVFASELCFAFPKNTDGEQLSEIFSLALKLVDTDEIQNDYIQRVSQIDYFQKDKYINDLIIIILTIIVVSLSILVFVFLIFIRKTKFIANHDSLTGIFNRRYYGLRLLELDNSEFYPLSIVVADLNGLKLINDAFGHEFGDNLLISAVDIFKYRTSEKDLVARVGGDEFIILMPNTTLSDAENAVMKMIEDSKNYSINAVQLSISYGLGVKINSSEDFQEIYRIAEDAMYRTKLLEVPSMRSDTINAIMKTLYEKDPYSELHSKSVSVLSEQIAKKMKLKFEDINDIKTAAILHDIGKIIIPSDILNRVGKLNEKEFIEMRKHSEIGFRILSSTSELRKLAELVLSHHERWDGTGYPSCLEGEKIPVQSRIIAIADAFDAMTSSRTYRSIISFEEALEELIACSGTQFDPKIVKVFSDHFDDIIANISS